MSRLWTEDPRLAAVYDIECADRHDYDFYLDLVEELNPEVVVDIGCGTGVFAVDLANLGRTAIGVDPAAAMLEIARNRPGGGQVEWIQGHASDVQAGVADVIVMMGHVAQYFVNDAEWGELLAHSWRILRNGGRLAFETRNPAHPWDRWWTEERTKTDYPHPAGGHFTSWVDVVGTTGPATSYAMTHVGHTVMPDGIELTASETLRFRSPEEIRASLRGAGFSIEAEWGDWDRSNFDDASVELIVLARRV